MANTDNKINVSDTWKDLDNIQINIANEWKEVDEAYINTGDAWYQFWEPTSSGGATPVDWEFGDTATSTFKSANTDNIGVTTVSGVSMVLTYRAVNMLSKLITISENEVSFSAEGNSGALGQSTRPVWVEGDKAVVAYGDSNLYIDSRVIDISTGTPSFSSIYEVLTEIYNGPPTIVRVCDYCVAVSYSKFDFPFAGYTKIGTISGNTISWGSEQQFNANGSRTVDLSSVMIDDTHICVSYRDVGNSSYGTSIIGTISGNSISWGSEYVFNSANTGYTQVLKIDDTHICVSYMDIGNSSYGTSIIGTITNDDEISWGSKYVFSNSAAVDLSSVMIDDTHICVSYRDGGNSYYGTSIIGTITNDDEISWSSSYVFASNNAQSIVSRPLNSNHIITFYRSGDDNYGKVAVIEIT